MIGKLLITVGLFESNLDTDTFHVWKLKDLLPKMPLKAVTVMDNATFHKRADIQNAIRNAGHILEYLPPYSPDLNPIERKRAQAKKLRRKSQCSIDSLFSQYPI